MEGFSTLAKDISGRRFGMLVAKHPVGRYGREIVWLCFCDCGTEKEIVGKSLRRGLTKSCGCNRTKAWSQSRIRHKHSTNGKPSRTYHTWQSMKDRCCNAKSEGYHNYGGRGIKVCDRWLESFDNFLADMGEKPSGLSLDRIDVNGHYEPGNCRWATWQAQMWNQRKTKYVNGKPLPQLCKELGLKYRLTYYLIFKRGLSLEEVISRGQK